MSIRKQIVGSRFLLPAVAVGCLALWVTAAGWEWAPLAGLLPVVLTTYILLEMNNRLTLLRIRSRAVSSSFLLLLTAFLPVHGDLPALCAAFLLTSSLAVLYSIYRDPQATARTFDVYLLFGLAVVLVPPLLVLLPLLWCVQSAGLQSFSWRVLRASVIGVLFPLAMLFCADFVFALGLFRADSPLPLLRLFDVEVWRGLWDENVWLARQSQPEGVRLAWDVLLFYAVPSALYFFSTSYSDRVRIRIYYHAFFFILLLLAVGHVVFADYAAALLPCATVVSAPLVARYVAFARGRFAEWWFGGWLLLWIVVVVVEYVL